MITERLVAAAQAGPLQANVEERWTRTATDGSGIDRGEPITLTWSVVPDGTAIDDALTGESMDDSDLIAYLDAAYGNQAVWQPMIQAALDEWNDGPGISFVYEPNDDQVKINGRNRTSERGVLGVRADIRIGGHDIDGEAGTVAYAYFPNGGGDMVIDTNDSFNTNPNRLHNVVSHEAGHALGLGHTCPINRTKLMEPIITLQFTGPQPDDLLGAHRNYGDVEEENDVVGESADIGLAIDSTMDVMDLALDDDGDEDWFVVPAGSLTEVSLALDPAGQVYPFGIEDDQAGCSVPTPDFNAAAVLDMSVEVVDFDGTTTLASADDTATGGSETLDAVRLSKFGGFIRISGGGNNDALAYELEVTLVPEPSRPLLGAAALATLAALAARRRRPLRA